MFLSSLKYLGLLIGALLFAGSLFINVAMLTWQAGALAIGAAFSTLTGTFSVVTGLADSNLKIKGRNNELRTQVSQLTSANQAFRQRHIEFRTTTGKLTDKISNRMRTNAARNLAAMPAEAIPYAGAAVVVGVTAFELKDACDTIADMQALNKLVDPTIQIDPDAVCGYRVPSAAELAAQIKTAPGDVYTEMEEWQIDIPSWQTVQSSASNLWTGSVDGAAQLFKYVLRD